MSIKNYNGFSVNTETLTGYTKKRFCEEFKKANNVLRPKTIQDVWEEIKGEIPKKPRQTKPKKVEKIEKLKKAASEEE